MDYHSNDERAPIHKIFVFFFSSRQNAWERVNPGTFVFVHPHLITAQG